MMEDDMIIYKDKMYNWEIWCVEWVRRFKVPAKANQQNGNWWRLIPRHFFSDRLLNGKILLAQA